jgi:hypothetical protein
MKFMSVGNDPGGARWAREAFRDPVIACRDADSMFLLQVANDGIEAMAFSMRKWLSALDVGAEHG